MSGLEIQDLIRDYHADVYRYAFRLAGQHADAEDLTQQCFATACSKLEQLRDLSRARGWLFVILRRCFLRTKRRRRVLNVSDLEMKVDELPARIPEQEDIDEEALQMALSALPDNLRLVLVMFYFDEMSYRKIAAELTIPIGTVMSRLSRAKGRLRHLLLSESMGPVDAGLILTGNSQANLANYVRAAPGTR